MRTSAKNSAPGESNSVSENRKHTLPPLKSLLAFAAAARHGSVAQGADDLGVTPSAVSHQIQTLEDFLGVKLFQRHAGRVTLTGEGLIYSRELEHAFAIIGDATTPVAPQSQRGHLVIASGPSFAAKWLQPRLSSFQKAHPDVKNQALDTVRSGIHGHEQVRYRHRLFPSLDDEAPCRAAPRGKITAAVQSRAR